MKLRVVLLAFACVVAACDDSEDFRHLDAGIDAEVDAVSDPDGDGDGSPASLDCNDGNPDIKPGAIERCNTIDDDCDTKMDETSAKFDPGSGAVDISEVFAPGTAAAPVAYTPPSAGKLTLCGGTYYAHITATANLEIAGADKATTIVDGGMKGRVVTSETAAVMLNVHDVTLTHGMATEGGALKCLNGTLTMTNAIVSANMTSMFGGGVLAHSCPATLTDVTITGNQAGVGAGGFENRVTTATLTRVTVSMNSAPSGGGIYNSYPGAQLNLIDSTITANTGTNGGGVNTEQTATCSNTKITANSGYGVWVASPPTYTSNLCDYGTDAATNNTPNDIRPAQAAGVDFTNEETFTCTSAGCTGGA